MKNEKGITLVSLAVTIIVIFILAGVATYSGKESIDNAKKTAFISEMEMIQAKVNVIYEKRKASKADMDYYNSIGRAINTVDQNIINTALNGTSKIGFRYFNQWDLKYLDLEDINQEVLINYDTREIVSLTGIQIDGVTYYKLKDIPNYVGYNVDYTPTNLASPTFTVEQTKLGNSEYRFTIKDIKYGGNVEGGTVSYKLHNDTNWILNGTNTSFIIAKPGIYDIKFTDKSGKSTTVHQGVYIEDGLIAHYDGEKNTRTGHDNNTNIWEDLSGYNNDATLNSAETRWESNCYNFSQGSMQYFETKEKLKLENSDRTIEFVVSSQNSELQNIFGIGSASANAMLDGLIILNGFNCHVYGNAANEGINEVIVPNKIYSNTWRYTNGIMSYRRNNTNKNNQAFFNLNTSVTNLFIGKGIYTQYNRTNSFRIYSIRIYDRVLTEQEIKTNYEIDQYRFGITQ